MKAKLILMVSILTISTQVYAKKNCTTEPKRVKDTKSVNSNNQELATKFTAKIPVVRR
jgi:hypothetical protein